MSDCNLKIKNMENYRSSAYLVGDGIAIYSNWLEEDNLEQQQDTPSAICQHHINKDNELERFYTFDTNEAE